MALKHWWGCAAALSVLVGCGRVTSVELDGAAGDADAPAGDADAPADDPDAAVTDSDAAASVPDAGVASVAAADQLLEFDGRPH